MSAGREPRDVPVVPPITAGRRAVLHAVRQAGDATADEVAAALEITVSGARQHLGALLDDGLVADHGRDPIGPPGPTRSSATTRPSWPTRSSRRRTARSPTSCSATSPTRTPRRCRASSPAAATIASPPPPSGWPAATVAQGQVDELARILDEDGYLATSEQVSRDVLPRGRAQLRHRRGRPPLRPGLHERARVHPDRAARGRPSSG